MYLTPDVITGGLLAYCMCNCNWIVSEESNKTCL